MDRVQSSETTRYKIGRGVLFLAVAAILMLWLMNTPSGLMGKADAVGYAVCHRIEVRSFHIGERQIPLCARCSGMYLGAVLGLAYMGLVGRKRSGLPPKRVWLVLGIFTLLFIVDGLNSYLHLPFFTDAPSLYEPSNTMRLLTGTGIGLAIAAVVYPAFNQTVWRYRDPQPAITGLKSLAILVAAVLVLDLLVLTENPGILYPLSIVSAFGVILVLTLVYAMLFLILFRRENRMESLRQLVVPLAAGFGAAMIQIALLDAVRYFFTGTWDGFHL